MIEVLIHSSIKISDERIIYIDPFMIKDTNNDADIILITHDHYDHYSKQDIDKVINDETVIVAPCSMKLQMNDYKNVILVNPNETLTVKDVEIETVRAYNTSKAFHPIENNWLGFVVKTNEGRVYIAGDTDENEDNLKVKCDIALVPVGGTYTMDPVKACEFVNKLKPLKAIPTHYGSAVGDRNCGEIFKRHVDKDIEVELMI